MNGDPSCLSHNREASLGVLSAGGNFAGSIAYKLKIFQGFK